MSAALVERIWARDATVWTGQDEQNWLGWLDQPWRMREDLDLILQLADSVVDRIDAVVLLGMGGSSLAPEVIKRTFRQETFHVLDTTHPQAIRDLERQLDVSRTLFISASKSGSTLETRSHTDYFWERTGGNGDLFIAITDPGSELEQLARQREFAGIFPGEPTIGGRYSALSAFGMVPAALMGVDVDTLLLRAIEMAEACKLSEGNPGLELGLSLGENWQNGRDKVCIAPNTGGFGLWAEQLIAESTGKQGKGLIPAPEEPPEGPDRQGQEVRLSGEYELGQEFFRWEFATAVAGSILGINPFDQPDVQSAKDKTRELLASGEEPNVEPEGSIDELFAAAAPGDYVSILAFVNPTAEAEGKLAALAEQARQATGCVVTHGFGPRYLHSTGQLHKGGPPTGLFLQVVDDTGDELAIPGQPFGFGKLIRAQAAGDFASLQERGRRIARIQLEEINGAPSRH
ncbi:MAG: transaldolase / glucose-6-phosphate isomerase [Gaiellaceae bacterium]|jgi:glucose-6-phosphate isomerase|nr:transaldolase / glucose-6-phosphate isomerase [Gaiellaceae bacterium]